MALRRLEEPRLPEDGRRGPSQCACRKTEALTTIDACVEPALSSAVQSTLRANSRVACLKYDDTLEGMFRTPTLLNVAETAPYFHSGPVKTLEEVVWFYNRAAAGAGRSRARSRRRSPPLGLTDDEVPTWWSSSAA